MATDMITLKLEERFLEEIDTVVEKEGYQNRTEFIRQALREKLEEGKIKKAMLELAHLKGASKKKTTTKEYEQARHLAFEKLEKMVK
ncbi:ribbon-helix-helix protein, CopG family [Candidatus Woesearchaeota archaeon]|nr:ribbon-helix-helix protein, CopG family [Candidatus Woesearchaeota archaeon]